MQADFDGLFYAAPLALGMLPAWLFLLINKP